MRKILRCVLFFCSTLAALQVSAQLDVRDSATGIWFLQPQMSIQFPQGDMKERFYTNTSVGFGLFRKTSSNWILGIEASYLFAEKVRNEDQILSNISTSEGFIIDQTGVFANIYFRERGFMANARFAKVFPTRFGNPNSGILLMGSLGILQHKIRIENYENTAPQLRGDYIKGYDKLTNGPSGSAYLGYIHFSNNRYTNFSIGAEYIYAFTRSRRDYDFVLMGKDESLRRDQLISLRLTWILPVYQRAPKEFYYN